MEKDKILIVEDESLTAIELKDRLNKWNYDVVGVASSGDKALDLAVNHKPDLILMDIMLQGEYDGVEAAWQIKKHLDVPVVFMTAYSDEATLERAKITEPYGYILKPFADRELQIILKMVINKHKVDKELNDYRAHFENTVKTRTSKLMESNQQLEKAMFELQKANQTKMMFLANMSHELRTPLNGIMGYTQILQMDKKLSSEQVYTVNSIYRSASHLLTLINDLLEISRSETLPLESYEFELAKSISAVVEIIRLSCQEKQIHFKLSIDERLPGNLLGDEKRLRQVLLNLLTNALKFTPAGEISLTISLIDNPQASLIRFIIKDTGIGIDPEKIDSIFMPFEKAYDPKTQKDGTGIGLTITKKIIEEMGGKIFVESQLQKGSAFRFDLPLSTGKSVQQKIENVDCSLQMQDKNYSTDEVPNHIFLSQLCKLAEIGDIYAIQEKLSSIENNVNYQKFIEHIRNFAKSYQVSRLNHFLKELIGNEMIE